MAILEIDRLSRRFGAVTAVDAVSFAVEAGEIFGIIGPNGAGKSTVINMISGVLRPSGGQVLFEGQPISHRAPWDIASLGISRTFQIVRLFHDLSVMENLLLAQHLLRKPLVLSQLLRLPAARAEARLLRARAGEVLEQLQLSHRGPHQVHDLSSAEQRRLQVAMALATGARLVLLDEPAAGLDRGEVAAFRDMISGLARADGRTFILIEHNVALVMSVCDRIMVLNFGQKIAEGAPDDIRRNPEVIRAYLGGVKA